MRFDNFNSLEHIKNNETKDNFFTNFLKELQNVISNFSKASFVPTSKPLPEDTIYVIRDINDTNLSLVNTNTGEEVDIRVVDSKQKIDKSKDSEFFSNIYEISKEDLYNLNLGSNITLKNGKCIPYYGKVEIKNSEAANKLEDMYFCIEQEKNSTYSVSSISDTKIYLTDIKEGGYFSIPQEAYPDFKVGDLVKNINGKYTLI